MKLIKFKNDQGVTYKELKMSGVTSLVIADETAEQLAEGMVISATVTDTTFDDALALCYASRLAAYPDIGQVMEALIKALGLVLNYILSVQFQYLSYYKVFLFQNIYRNRHEQSIQQN